MAERNGATSTPPSGPQTSTLRTPLPSQLVKAQAADLIMPVTSLSDSGLSKRPRDARLVHMILANLGVTAYQERVPLQLMDFAYRYTSSTLQDALHLASEHYGSAPPGGGRGAGGAANDTNSVTLSSLRLSVASRMHYQYNPTLPKDFYQDLAQERNRVALPPVGKDWGIRLPPEKYCLTGVGWGLRDEWDSEVEAEGDGERRGKAGEGGEMDLGEREGVSGEDNDERMEDFFGEGSAGGGADKEMEVD